MIRYHRILILLGAVAGSSLMGQTAQSPDARITALESAVKSAQMSGDNAWMLISAALVLMMTGPGPGAVLRRPGAAQERARAP